MRAEGASYRVGDNLLLNNVNLSLRAETFHALVGPNGAGKSTLLHVLAGDAYPTAGEVLFDQRPVRDFSKRELALKRSVMPQDVMLSLAFTAEEVVTMGRYPHMMAKRGAERQHAAVVDESMQATDSAHMRERLYPTLSGGEQARVTLARVLAQETPVVFLDEPTASLDPRHQHLVMRLARRMAQQGGTVLAVLHDLNLASMYADDVILMSAGCIRAQGPPLNVLQPTILEDVFQTKFHVIDHPKLQQPLVVSLPEDV